MATKRRNDISDDIEQLEKKIKKINVKEDTNDNKQCPFIQLDDKYLTILYMIEDGQYSPCMCYKCNDLNIVIYEQHYKINKYLDFRSNTNKYPKYSIVQIDDIINGLISS